MAESSDNEDEEVYGTSSKDNNGDSDGNGGGDSNTGDRGGSVEWLRFFSPRARTEALGAMAKDKASSLTASRKKLKLGRRKSKIALKGKASHKLVKNLLKTAGQKNTWGLLKVQQPQPIGRLVQIREEHVRKN